MNKPVKIKLRPMAEAPKTTGHFGSGPTILLWTDINLVPVLACWNARHGKWAGSGGYYDDSDFIGWLPLPEVEI